MKSFSLTRLVRNVAVIALALWLAGAGCLLGCEGIATAAAAGHHEPSESSSQASPLVVEGDACASTEGHSCCKKKPRAAKKQTSAPASQIRTGVEVLPSRTLNESSSSGVKACPFAISRALAVVKIGDGKMTAVPMTPPSLLAESVREQKRALSTLSPLPNRGHTYLTCCSFLI